MPFESATDAKTDKKGLSMSEVKSIENGLECSPSQHQSTSNYGGKAKIIRHSGSNVMGGTDGKLESAKGKHR